MYGKYEAYKMIMVNSNMLLGYMDLVGIEDFNTVNNAF